MHDDMQRGPKAVFVVVSVLVIVLAFVLVALRPMVFDPYFGGLPPIATIAIVCSCGWVALHLLERRGEFLICRSGRRARNALIATALAMPFMIAITLIDLMLPFPNDINVSVPDALLFYPVMAYVAELAFRAAPLAVLLCLFGFLSSHLERRHVWIAILVVAVLEPVYQIASPSVSAAHALMLAPHLYLFGVIELLVFRRCDFLSMLAFRVAYYAYWHVVWGYVRLELAA